MADQDSVQARKSAAAGASNNSGIGIDGDGLSVADIKAGGDADHNDDRDPVTGTTDNATGAEQAAENEDREPVG